MKWSLYEKVRFIGGGPVMVVVGEVGMFVPKHNQKVEESRTVCMWFNAVTGKFDDGQFPPDVLVKAEAAENPNKFMA